MGVIVADSIGGSDGVTVVVSGGGSDDDDVDGSGAGSVAVSDGGSDGGSADDDADGSGTGTTTVSLGLGVAGTPTVVPVGVRTGGGAALCVSEYVSASIAESVGAPDGVVVPGRSHGVASVALPAGGGPVSPGAS